MASNISILISAKDQASATVARLSKSISSNVSEMGKQVQGAMNAAAAGLGAVGVGLTAYSKQSLDYAMELNGQVKALARQTGLTTEEGSRLMYVIQRMGGSAEGAATMFNTFAKNITKADGPLKDLGITTRDVDDKQRGFRDILLDVSDKFKGMPDGVEKTALALQLFGRQGTDMIKVLNNGREGIIELEKSADKLGVTLTDKNAAALTAYAVSQKKIAESTGALKLQIAGLTAPVLTTFNETLHSMTQKVIGTESPLRNAIANVIAFGGPVSATAGGLLAFMANISTVNGGLGAFITVALGAAAALGGAGGLVVVMSQFMGLNFGPLQTSLGHLFDVFIESLHRSSRDLGAFAESPAWARIRTHGNLVIEKLADSIDRVTKALSEGGWGAALQQISSEFSKLDIQGMLVTVIDQMADFPWEQHSEKITEGLLRLLSSAADNVAQFMTRATPSLLKIAVGIIDGLISGIFSYAVESPIDFALLFLSLGFAPARVLGPLLGVLSKIPIIGPFLSWIISSLAVVADFVLGPVKNLFGKVGGEMLKGIKGGWDNLFGSLKGAVDNGLAGIGRAAMSAFNFVKDINWGAAIGGAGKSIGNAVIGLIEGALNGALKGIPGKPSIKIPRFEKGVRNFGGGLAVVGDVNGRGGELLNLPSGTDVYSNRESKAILGAGGGGDTNVTIEFKGPVSFGDQADINYLADRIAAVFDQRQRRASGGMA